jgi:hypothetical protein
MRNFTIFTPHQVLLGCLIQRGWNGQDMRQINALVVLVHSHDVKRPPRKARRRRERGIKIDLKEQDRSLGRINFFFNRGKWSFLVNMVMNRLVREFLTS